MSVPDLAQNHLTGQETVPEMRLSRAEHERLKRQQGRRRALTAYAFLLPNAIFFIAFLLHPWIGVLSLVGLWFHPGWVWAVLAFVMNYVPNVGIILSVVPPVILTLLELGWQRALVVLAGFLVLNFVVDNLIKPRFLRSGLDVPPLLGLLSLVVWAAGSVEWSLAAALASTLAILAMIWGARPTSTRRPSDLQR